MKIIDDTSLQDRIAAFFPQKLNLEVPAIETDLVETGILDSLGLVDLMLHLEQEFGIEISIENLEIDNFRSIERIAEFVDAHSRVACHEHSLC
jgi:acyl carrier protein